MPIPSPSRTERQRPTTVEAFYLGRKDGAVEQYILALIDYDEAVAARPEQWTLEPPAAGKRIIDRRHSLDFPGPQIAQAPPMVERTQSVGEIVRNPTGGS